MKCILRVLLIAITLYSSEYAVAQNSLQKQYETQFDFWIGDWNVYKHGTDTIVGISSIKPILNHKSIEENYQSLRYQYQGKSLNIYNEKEQRWEQFWVDNSGLRLFLNGGFNDGKMVLSDCPKKDACNRITWTDLGNGEVHQEWEQSKDKGKTWEIVFDGHYKRRK